MARIKWQKPTKENLQKASDAAQVIVLYFGERADDDKYFNAVDVDGLVLANAVACFRVESSDEEIELERTTVVPQSKFGSADLWQSYGVTEEGTFVVADRYGNAVKTTQSCELKDTVKDVSRHFRGVRKDLRKINKFAEDAIEDGDLRDAIDELHEGFENGLVGYKESDEAAELYEKAMDAIRAELKKTTSPEGLENLRKQYGDTDVAKDIDAAIEKLKAVSE